MTSCFLGRSSVALNTGPIRRSAATRVIRRATLPILAFLALLSGCQAPAPTTGPTRATIWIDDRDAFFDEALSALRSYSYTPGIVDRENGLIRSQPETSKQWFEFWRKDASSGYQTLESSLHTMRRIVTVELEQPGSEPAPGSRPAGAVSEALEPARASREQPYVMTVTVEKQRFNAPERQVTNITSALGIYSERLPTSEGLRNAATAGERWISIGRDADLERALIADLARGRRFSEWDPATTGEEVEESSRQQSPSRALTAK